MSIHKRIKHLRIEKEWTQIDLSKKVGVKQKQISAYETGVSKPSTDVLIKLAKIFDVTLDFLVSEMVPTKKEDSKGIQDAELFEYFKTVDQFKENDKELIKKVLDAFVKKTKLEELVAK